MIRADSTKFALDEAAALAEAMPEPPLPLGDDAAAFWGTIIGAKRSAVPHGLTPTCLSPVRSVGIWH